MADIRIKDLTTLESASLTGDVFVIDGTTGTRKLSAFSPTFGGNATVTGNLTVNGTGNSSFAGQLIQVADPATIALWKDATPTKAARFQFNTLADNGFSLGVYDGSSWFNAITVAPTTGVVKIPSSSASSSTITGALVVSGGVGVGGAVFTGGYVHPGGDSNFYIRTTGSSNGLIRANFLSADVASGFLVRNDTGTTEYVRVDSAGLIAAIPATAPSLTVNGTMTFERTSNTSLKISVRGTDGTTRSVSLTLA